MKKVVLILLLLFLAGCRVQEPIVKEIPVAPEPIVEAPVNNIIEEPIIKEPVKEIPEELTLGVKGKLVLTDEMYEFEEREYEYNSDTFGVGGIEAHKYTGPAPTISADNSFSMRVFNFGEEVDIEFNYDYDFEVSGPLAEGDSYVTRDGIKIVIEKVFSNKFIFTISKVSSDEHTEHCSECVKFKTIANDDGVRYVGINGPTVYNYRGEDYSFRVIDTSTGQLRVNGEDVPVLSPNQEYVLKDDTTIKFLFSAVHGKSDEFGYVAFGFVDSYLLPNRAYCPDCSDFMYLVDSGDIRVGQVNKKISVADNKLTFDGSTVDLVLGEMVYVTDDLSVQLIEKVGSQYRLGLVLDDILPFVSCREYKGGGVYAKGEIIFKTGSLEYSRTDFCVDSKTLIEYSCVPAVGRDYDPEDEDAKGEGATANMTYVDCNCYNGACRD